MSIPTLANKASLSLFYNNDTRVDFSPYNEFAKVIQRVYLKYIVKVRASVYIQKMYRGFSWREILFRVAARPSWRHGLNYIERPILSNRRQKYHASMKHTRVLFRFTN